MDVSHERTHPASTPTTISWYAPVLLALVYMLPRILRAQFGLLDDAAILTNAPQIVEHPLFSLVIQKAHGRFVPGYWLYWTFWYWIGGLTPAIFYVANTLMLLGAVACIVAIMARCGARRWEAWLAGVVFLGSAPVAEAYFTLCKGEPLAVLALLASVLVALSADRARHPWQAWVAVTVLGAVAVSTRETAVSMVGAGLGWAVLTVFWRSDTTPVSRRTALVYAVAFLVGAMPLLIGGMWLRRAMPAGAYAAQYALGPSALALGAALRPLELVRDWPAFLLLCGCAGALIARRQAQRLKALMMLLIWAAASLVILLPWGNSHPYYLLIFGTAASMFCALTVGELVALRRAGRRWASVCLWISALLLAATMLNSVSASRYQIMVDEVNATLLDQLRQLPRESVVLANMPFDYEYVAEISMHVWNLLGRPDIRFEPLNFAPPDPRDAAHPYFVITSFIRHGRWPAVRGINPDVVLAGWETSWLASRRVGLQPVALFSEKTQLADVATEQLWCQAVRPFSAPLTATFCRPFTPFLDLGTSEYGWRVDRYAFATTPITAASFHDGTWTIDRASLPAWTFTFGQGGDVPLGADWDGDGRMDPAVYRPSTQHWLVDLTLSGKPDLDFVVPGMAEGDVPLAGDWTGKGRASPGFYRPNDASWHLLDGTGPAATPLPVVHFGSEKVRALVGDWDGDGRATPGFFQPEEGVVCLLNQFRDDAPQTVYGLGAGVPVVANWSGLGVDTVDLVRPGSWIRRAANCACEASNPMAAFAPQLPAGTMLVGPWHQPRRPDEK